LIPSVVHYCWFGGKPKPNNVRQCIESWRKYLKGYEFKEWNESNFEFPDIPFVQRAKSEYNWAFLSDYARLKVLYDYGGVYLDTDMLIIKSLDPFLKKSLFFGKEDDEFINCAIIGADKSNPFLNLVLRSYHKFDYNYDVNNCTIPAIITREYNLCKEKYPEFLIDIEVYPVDYFYPFPHNGFGNPLNYITENTYSIHLWNGSWLSPKRQLSNMLKRGYILNAIFFTLKSIMTLDWSYENRRTNFRYAKMVFEHFRRRC
jgi:mannosyltransferase OCH1-like enzyme